MPDRRLVWVDLSGHETALPVPPGPLDPLDISADGQNLLLTRFDPAKQVWSLWSYSLVTFEARQLAGANPNRIVATWSPDGKQVVFNRINSGEKPTNLFRLNADGTGDAEQLTHVDAGGNVPQSWSRDGKWLVYEDGMRPDTKSDIWARAMVGDPKPHPVVSTPDYDRNPSLSPDGRWLAYVHETAGDAEVFLQSFPNAGTPVKVGPGTGPLWDPKGARLYVRRGSKMFAVDLQLGADVKVGESHFLFEGKYVSPDLWLREQLISPDGKRFLLTKEDVDPNEARRIQVVVNWFTELTRLFRPTR
jgi:Tol biopolymer transport system component